MKANEAPEKLYYAPYGDIREDNPITDNDIEYVRKDAFMERAKKWFEKRNEWIGLDGFIYRDMESFEDFKNYMKGE